MATRRRMSLPLPYPEYFHVNAAIGWLELGNHIEAEEELKKIAPKNRTHPEVLAVRWSILAKAENWESAYNLALSFTQLAPDNAQGWVDLSISHYRLGRTQAAWDCLAAVASQFPEEWLVSYNMACYATQLGRLDEADSLLRKSLELGDKEMIRQHALNDPDLEPLRKHSPLFNK